MIFCILKTNYLRMFPEDGMDNLSLGSRPAAVDNANPDQAFSNRLIQIFFDQPRDFARPEGVQVDRIRNRQSHYFQFSIPGI